VAAGCRGGFDLLIYSEPEEGFPAGAEGKPHWSQSLLANCPCRVLTAPRMQNLDVVDE